MTKSQIDKIINTEIDNKITQNLSSDGITDDFIASRLFSVSGDNDTISYVLDDIINLDTGDKITLRNGNIQITGTGTMVNVATGSTHVNPTNLQTNTQYIVVEDSNFQIKVTSLTAKMNIKGPYSYSNSYKVMYENQANALESLGLFKGTDYGFELNRPASRIESLIMLIRLLGEEEQALSYSGTHSFTDVADWATNYVAYAYDKGYTKGVTTTIFGSDTYVKDKDYYTFVLRALGFEDGTDFEWSTAYKTALEKAIIPMNFGEKDVFYRDDTALVSYNALDIQINNSDKKLYENLIEKNVISLEEYNKIK